MHICWSFHSLFTYYFLGEARYSIGKVNIRYAVFQSKNSLLWGGSNPLLSLLFLVEP